MAHTECHFHKHLTPEDIATALETGRCYRCSITVAELLKAGKLMEVCGEEYLSDLSGGQVFSFAIGICPDCHKQAHLDAEQNPEPCPIRARRSREWIDRPSPEADALEGSDAQP